VIARGSDADRHTNLLIYLPVEGQLGSDAYLITAVAGSRAPQQSVLREGQAARPYFAVYSLRFVICPSTWRLTKGA